MKTKVCSKCKESKPISAFTKEKKTKDGLKHCCKSCSKVHKLKSRYNITKEQYDKLLTAQNNRCAICKIHINDVVNPNASDCVLCVDHDHKTNEIRGLLCHKCNLLLGNAGDDETILQSALTYLRTKK